jgi:ankyrin repeat protein
MQRRLTRKLLTIILLIALLRVTTVTGQNTDQLLLLASSAGDTLAISILLKEGAMVNVRTDYGTTPLTFAVANNRQAAVELLLKMGADPNIIDYYGENVLNIAVKNQSIPIAELLIKSGADINIKDSNGATPLHYAALYGFYYEADMLLYYEADFEIKAKDGTTPLMAAVMSGSYDIADILIQSGANVNTSDRIGYTPLLIAAQNGDTLTMELLLRSGSSLYAAGNDGFNAAGIAIRDNHPKALRYLLRYDSLWSSQEAVNLWRIAGKYQNREVIPILTEFRITKPGRNGFDEVMAGISLYSTSHQSMPGFQIRIKETMNGLGLIAGVDLKPWGMRILIKEDDYNFTQYIDRRTLVWAGGFKEYRIPGPSAPVLWHVSVSGKGGYKFGNKYPGSDVQPEHGLVFIPGLSLSAEANSINISASLEYLRTEVYKSGPVWLRISLSYNYSTNNIRSAGKFIRWR